MIIGENHLVRVALTGSDQTPLLLSSLSLLSASIIQRGIVIAGPFVYGTDNEIRQGTTTSEVEVEITKAVSATFKSGIPVYLQLTMEKTDADFDIDGVHKDIAKIELFDVD